MNIIFTHNPSEKVINETYDITMDFTKDYFTENFPSEIIIDMNFQRTAYLIISYDVIIGLFEIELYTHIPEKRTVNANTVAFYESVGLSKKKNIRIYE